MLRYLVTGFQRGGRFNLKPVAVKEIEASYFSGAFGLAYTGAEFSGKLCPKEGSRKMLAQVLLFLLGLSGLFLGAEGLVRGSARLARLLGVSSLAIGLTLVAFGTSAPELAVSLTAAVKGLPFMALGNAVGSNICNIGVGLGLSALIRPLKVKWALVKGEIPFLLAVSFVFYLLAANKWVSRAEGALLFIGLLGFLAFVYRRRKEALEIGSSLTQVASPIGRAKALATNAFLALGGLGLLLLGANLLVNSGKEIAFKLGVSEGVIGLSLVAVGTSLPEFATSAVAAAHKEHDISIGNIVGSNVFNLLGVVGLVSLIHPLPLEREWIWVQIPVMLLFSLALLPIMWDKSIHKWEGGALLLGYSCFIFWLFAG